MKSNMFTSFVCSTLLAIPVSAIAQTYGNGNPFMDNGKSIPIYERSKSNPGRPKIPSQQHIECVYTEGTLHFFFAFPEGECLLTVTDSFSGISTQYSFDSAEPAEIFVGEIQTGSIEIQTANGHEYFGSID